MKSLLSSCYRCFIGSKKRFGGSVKCWSSGISRSNSCSLRSKTFMWILTDFDRLPFGVSEQMLPEIIIFWKLQIRRKISDLLAIYCLPWVPISCKLEFTGGGGLWCSIYRIHSLQDTPSSPMITQLEAFQSEGRPAWIWTSFQSPVDNWTWKYGCLDFSTQLFHIVMNQNRNCSGFLLFCILGWITNDFALNQFCFL